MYMENSLISFPVSFIFIFCPLQIKMSTETERRVGNLLDSLQEAVAVDGPSAVSSQGVEPSSSGASITSSVSNLEIDTAKEGLSVELKQKQEKTKVLLAKLCRSQHYWLFTFLWNNCYEHFLT